MERKRIDIPPTYFIASLILIILLHTYLPIATIFSSTGSELFGIVLLFTGFGMIIWGSNSFRYYETPIRPHEKATYLIQSGLFRYSRNPIYLGMVVVIIGAIIFMGSLSPVIVIPLFILIIQSKFIRKEEEHLEQIFGDYYREYKNKVRRWI